MRDDECKSFVPGNLICRDGFPVTAYCMGYKCHGCGAPSKRIPLCLQDEVPEHFIDEAGRMTMRREASDA